MANYYLRSSDGNDAAAGTPGAPWATMAGADGQMAAGDTLYVSDEHSEYTNGSIELVFPGTPATPNRLLCIEDWGAETDPGAITHTMSAGAAVANGGGSRTMLFRGCFVADGITWTNGGAGNLCSLRFANVGLSSGVPQLQVFRNGTINSSLSAYGQMLGGNYIPSGILVIFDNMTINWRAANYWTYLRGTMEFRNCTFSGTAPNAFFTYSTDTNANDAVIRFVNTDLSFLTSGKVINDPGHARVSRRIVELYRCRLASGVVPSSAYLSPGAGYVRMVDCDYGTNYVRQYNYGYLGTVTEDTVRVRDNSKSLYSHKLVSTANTKFYSPLRSFPVARYNATEGSAITVRVEILASDLLTNGDFWVEANYLGSASYPLGSIASSAKADILAAASNLATSSEGWTTTGVPYPIQVTGNPNPDVTIAVAYPIFLAEWQWEVSAGTCHLGAPDYDWVLWLEDSPYGTWSRDAADGLEGEYTALGEDGETGTITVTALPCPRYYIDLTFTPQKSGTIEITACLAKPSTTVYVDPDVTVS